MRCALCAIFANARFPGDFHVSDSRLNAGHLFWSFEYFYIIPLALHCHWRSDLIDTVQCHRPVSLVQRVDSRGVLLGMNRDRMTKIELKYSYGLGRDGLFMGSIICYDFESWHPLWSVLIFWAGFTMVIQDPVNTVYYGILVKSIMWHCQSRLGQRSVQYLIFSHSRHKSMRFLPPESYPDRLNQNLKLSGSDQLFLP